MREAVIGMDLDGKRFACEQQLEKKRRPRLPGAGPLVPDLTNFLIAVGAGAPPAHIADSPRLRYENRPGVFDRHNLTPIRLRADSSN
jgi:hypothetical protein